MFTPGAPRKKPQEPKPPYSGEGKSLLPAFEALAVKDKQVPSEPATPATPKRESIRRTSK